MRYISTRGGDYRYSSAEAIRAGIAPNGGLFVPESIPRLTSQDIQDLMEMDYPRRAATVLSRYLTDFSFDELLEYTNLAYGEDKFDAFPAKVTQLNPYNKTAFMLELWHGPTSAFKDMALQLLPYLMTAAARKLGEDKEICILTATSGDTGKAALEGFKDVPNTRVIVFYPHNGVSKIQYLQMATQTGDNCHVIAVKGSFDDTQSGVKTIFNDEAFCEQLEANHQVLSSANSINWGRLVPQIAYYVSTYADLLKGEFIEPGEAFNIVVPTGNFGNILAAWYALQMGVPIGKLVCASNRNKILSDFLRSGTYDRNRPFFMTNSPSMDILISSNLERLLFELTDHDAAQVATWMEALQNEGVYDIDDQTRKRIQTMFVGGFCDERGTIHTISDVYETFDHVVDTHTAVGFNVYQRYAKRSQDHRVVVFVSTASPFKFAGEVAKGIFEGDVDDSLDEQALMELLAEESDMLIPAGLNCLVERPILHDTVIEKEEMKETIEAILDVNS
ncbi:MAG TPA: threonine synthase [Clostridiaceae bacterium]|nr:threonine synthase [Clostridiaceae bacterium]